ncbi:unnamed protein product [Rotaria sp. Silwood1]|nr:unnamed protein product [Rotaria sp. Silwood1]
MDAKMNMEYASIQLTDLPDEILMIIFKKLDGVEILYSLLGVNKQLNKIVHDRIFTSVLTLLKYHLDDRIDSLSFRMLNRFCSEILPQIHNKIQWLNLETSSMRRILRSTYYPNLIGLGLYELHIEEAEYLFSEETLILRYKNQISSLIIGFGASPVVNSTETMRLLFKLICDTFTNLQYLNFGPYLLNCYQQLSYALFPPTVFSSTLLELHVNLQDYIDCIYLLDGRFNQLHTLHVYLKFISTRRKINNKEKLPKLRCFSLSCNIYTDRYDDLILPLLHRMTNLEKLELQFVCERKTFIDGDDLKTNIIDYLLQLNTFTFNIQSISYGPNKTNLSSNEDIQQIFKDFKYNQVISCVDYFEEWKYSQCLIFSYPYKWKYYNDITNKFPGGLFKCVQTVSLLDDRPFEHEFFLQIAQSFPLLKKLNVSNRKAQKNKQCHKSANENENLSIIKYHHLTQLGLEEAHEDYIEEFLLDTKTHLPNRVYLLADHRLLAKVTHNFERHSTRINCSKLIHFIV